jgi:tetratricopeptide (TPR) repeat protein
MVFYFLRVKNYEMAEKTCRIVMEMAPHNLTVLGFMTEAFIGQGRFEEALKVGVPVVELSAQLGELPERMGASLVKKLAEYLIAKKDYAGAARLWEAGVKCQPGEVSALVELSKSLLLAGDITGAERRSAEARALAPQNEAVLELLKAEAFATGQAGKAGRSVRVKRRR